ncbi:hypothetical protein N7474_001788 [Penicillium riverlandense]|uniref:uncharacterized protein n=1 Tax=Penicillium riverlandense TaxID=1903569 RepID=UPI002548027E|nr:uncharacterized protein N7474_001788 [Penicillium riverlandense]KAJ5833477.1 hypothetical protein N7474_001788 [Penicillium riverlandense]
MYQNKVSRPPERRIRRAAAACYHCHWRKVRCDAALTGFPCTNCKLDERDDCTLRPNTTARFKKLQKDDGECSPPKSTGAEGHQRVTPPASSENESTPQAETLLQDLGYPDMPAQVGTDLPLEMPHSANLPGPFSVDPSQMMLGNAGFAVPGQNFLDLEGLSTLPMSEVHILATNGCLEIPPKPAIDVFLGKYFLLLHPCLPILDESQFWNIYLQSNDSPIGSPKISLFVFQAMLLASCAVLYDTGFENDPLARAQGSMLLTFHTTAEDPQATMTWNLCAIQNAMMLRIDTNILDNDPKNVSKKRLWWSVFVRDRILWLGRHRRPQFISANFTPRIGYLEEEDFSDEIMFSAVYEPKTKRESLKIFQAQCRLAIILTDVISIAFSSSDGFVPCLPSEELHASLDRIQTIKSNLARWKKEFQTSLHPTDLSQQETIDVLTHLTMMHYQTARMALAHHETLLLETHRELLRDKSATMLLAIAKELQSSVSQMTQTMAYFASKDYTENIPLSVLAYCGTPMVLAAIDVKLSSSYSEMLERGRALDHCSGVVTQSRKAYDVTDFFSEGTNEILNLAYTITKNLFLENGAPQNATSTNQDPGCLGSHSTGDENQHGGTVPSFKRLKIKGWIEAFLKYPRAYLLLSTCIDQSLASGRLPRAESLPPLVQGTISMILGLPKLPWTIETPKDLIDDRVETAVEKYNKLRNNSAPNAQDPCLNDAWYWTLLSSLTGGPDNSGVPGINENVIGTSAEFWAGGSGNSPDISRDRA